LQHVIDLGYMFRIQSTDHSGATWARSHDNKDPRLENKASRNKGKTQKEKRRRSGSLPNRTFQNTCGVRFICEVDVMCCNVQYVPDKLRNDPIYLNFEDNTEHDESGL